jgi:methyl-accepting chemotaxis protein
MRFDDLKLTTKNLLPLALTCLLFLGTTLLGAYRMNDIATRYDYLTEHSDAAVMRMLRSNRAATQIGYAIHTMIAYEPQSALSKTAEEEFLSAGPRIDGLLGEAARLDPARAATIGAFRDRIAKLVEQAKPAVAIARDLPGLEIGSRLQPHELDELARCLTILRGVDTQMQSLTSDMRSYYVDVLAENHKIGEEQDRQASVIIWTMLIVGALAILGGCAVSIFVSSRKIGRPIARLTDQMGAIAGGNLSIEVEGVERRDEVGAMAKALDTFKRNAEQLRGAEARATDERRRSDEAEARRKDEQAVGEREREQALRAIAAGLENLAAKNLAFRLSQDVPDAYRRLKEDFDAAISQLEAALADVASGAGAIGSGASQISAAADDLARRTEQQAASLEETAAALEEITVTVKHAAEGAAHARDIVGATRSEAERSSGVVREAVDAMGRIEKSSQQIGQIIGVIDEIAFQTNLLALNAGVEAARAGDAGKGFAVVASEVRALAQRSAEAARDIKGLISTSAVEVEQGVERVGQTGRALDKIAAQVAEIDRVVTDIASGAREQATSLGEINTAVTQMDQSTQKNAAMVEQTTAASHNLRRETEQLLGAVGSFQLGRSHAAARPQRAPRPALKTVGAGGAVRKEQAAPDGWEEF